MKTLSDIVGATLGPGGNPILIERPGFKPLISKDGVTVAEAVTLADSTEYVIAEAAKEVCQRTNKEVGDGTTTAIVLAHVIVEEGMKFLGQNPTKSPQELVRELDSVVIKVTDALLGAATPIDTKESIKHVALISSNSDEDVASAVVEALDLVGDDGCIVTEEGSGRATKVELKEGFPVNKGLSSFGVIQELFLTDPANQECALAQPAILLYDGDLISPQDIGLFLQRIIKDMGGEFHPVVIVAHKYSPQVLKLIAMNVQSSRASIGLLETIGTAQPHSKHHFLHDLAAFTGAKVLDPMTNILSTAVLEDLGTCEKVRIGRYQSVFFGAPEEAKIKERMDVLKTQMDNAESDFDSELIKERIAQLSGGIATIYVGGASELEMREKKHRIEDAINAARSAIDAGVVPGGGAALLAATRILLSPDLPPSASILRAAFTEPFHRIMKNSGALDDQIAEMAQKVMDSIPADKMMPTAIFDSLRHEVVNPFAAGIIDPAKVVISALKNAFSIAKLLMTVGGAIAIPRDPIEERQSELQTQALNQTMGQQ
jgi:chaperonin GroEL